MGAFRRLKLVTPLLVLLLIVTAGRIYAGPHNTKDTIVYFHGLNDSACTRQKLVQVAIEGYAEVTLRLLESSRDFLPADSPADSLWATASGHVTPRRPCYYQGEAVASGDRAGGGDLAVAKLSHDGLFSATFHHNGLVYEVPPQPHSDSQSRPARLYGRRLPPPAGPKRRCPLASAGRGAAAAGLGGSGQQVRGRRSALALDTRSEVAQAARKFVQMVLVGDEAFYKAFDRNMVRAQDKLWEIGNYVNSLYKQLGTSVVIVRAIVWPSDPYTLTNKAGTINSTEMLEKFMVYRMQNLNNVPHNVAQLVSGLRMSGSDVGLAYLGKLCHFAYGGAVNSDNDITGNAINVAVTIAHELGHNLGMIHDEDDLPCPCPDPQGCIMKAVGGDVNPLRFSACSVKTYLEFTVPDGLGYCTSRQPDASVRPASEAPSRCGNRIVEAGEDCDCGLASWCNNSCCNPNTCKFAAGASCASGQCCNIATCALTAKGTECRAVRGPCDLPEFCNGVSEWCPEFDDFLIDGTPCAASAAGQTTAYCHLGECATRDSRCQSIFNGTGYRDAPEQVYNSMLTAMESETGYCSYRATAYTPLSYEYQKCTFENRKCGALYCIGQGSDSHPTPKWKSMPPQDTRSIELTLGGSTLEVAFARLDLRPSGFRDPGMVPNGAECGAGMMCIDSRCLTVASVTALVTAGKSVPNCNGNGRLAQSVQCYCNSGFSPPACLLPGAGGSATNQPAFSTNATTTTRVATSTTKAGTGLSSSTIGGILHSTTVPNATTTTRVATSTTKAGIGLSSSTIGGILHSTTVRETPQDNYWLYVGIGVAVGILLLLLAVGLFLLLWWWCRRRGGKHEPSPTPQSSFVIESIGAKPAGSGSLHPGLVQGPPAHLAEFYENLRRSNDFGSWKGHRYWPNHSTMDPVDNSQMA